jgi:hypothetical protein
MAATTFSRSSAPPPPFVRTRSGVSSSAPSTQRSSRSTSPGRGADAELPAALLRGSDVGTPATSSPRAASASRKWATVDPVPEPEAHTRLDQLRGGAPGGFFPGIRHLVPLPHAGSRQPCRSSGSSPSPSRTRSGWTSSGRSCSCPHGPRRSQQVRIPKVGGREHVVVDPVADVEDLGLARPPRPACTARKNVGSGFSTPRSSEVARWSCGRSSASELVVRRAGWLPAIPTGSPSSAVPRGTGGRRGRDPPPGSRRTGARARLERLPLAVRGDVREHDAVVLTLDDRGAEHRREREPGDAEDVRPDPPDPGLVDQDLPDVEDHDLGRGAVEVREVVRGRNRGRRCPRVPRPRTPARLGGHAPPPPPIGQPDQPLAQVPEPSPAACAARAAARSRSAPGRCRVRAARGAVGVDDHVGAGHVARPDGLVRGRRRPRPAARATSSSRRAGAWNSVAPAVYRAAKSYTPSLGWISTAGRASPTSSDTATSVPATNRSIRTCSP